MNNEPTALPAEAVTQATETLKAMQAADSVIAASEPAEPANKKKKPKPPVEPEKVGILLRYEQMEAMGDLGLYQYVYIVNTDSGLLAKGDVYWRNQDAIMTHDPKRYYAASKAGGAHKWSYYEWRNFYGGNPCYQYFEPVDQVWAAEAVKKKGSIEKIVPAHILSILRKAPENPQGRAMLLAITKKAMPDSIKTFEELETWVVDKCGPAPASLTIPDPPPAPIKAFSVEFKRKQTAYGRADYIEKFEGEFEEEITSEVLDNILANYRADLPFSDLIDLIRSDLEVLFYGKEVRVEPIGGSKNYTSHRRDGFEEHATTLRGGVKALAAKVTDYLKAHKPEEAARRGIQ